MNAATNDDRIITSYADAPARTIRAGAEYLRLPRARPEARHPGRLLPPPRRDPGQLGPPDRRCDRREHATSSRSTSSGSERPPARSRTPSRQAADDAYTFITALGFDTIDVFSFSMGGMVAQDLVVKHPDLVRKLVLTGTGPRGGKDMDKVVGVTYWDILRATADSLGPEGVPVLQPQRDRQDGRQGVRRPAQGAHRRPRQDIGVEGFPDPAQGDREVRPLRTLRPVGHHPADAHRQRRQRPHGPVDPVRGPAPPHRRVAS